MQRHQRNREKPRENRIAVKEGENMEKGIQYTTEVFEFPNGKAYVHHPILTPEERERRMESLKRETIRFAMKLEQNRAKKAAEKEA